MVRISVYHATEDKEHSSSISTLLLCFINNLLIVSTNNLLILSARSSLAVNHCKITRGRLPHFIINQVFVFIFSIYSC